MAYDIDELIRPDAETEARIADGIERNRKGTFTVRAKPGERVRAKLVNHKFRFGCNLFMLDEIPDDAKKNDVYKAKIKELFNIATVPFYWDATEPEEGKTRYGKDSPKMYRRPPTDLCVEFCEQNGIEPREHALCYDRFFPDWLSGKPDAEVKRHLEKRMREIADRYKDRIPTIEVTNEMLWDEGKTQFYHSPDFMTFCYEKAAEYFPHNKLCVNEWTGAVWDPVASPWNNYYALIENVLLKGGRIDAIGLQYHLFFRAENYFTATRRLFDRKHLLAALDTYAAFGKPIHITEVTVPAFTDDAAGEASQADVIERLYKLWFSHPNVEQIVYWNLVDGYAFNAEPGDMSCGENYYRGGLLRFDMSEKPAFRRLRHLIKEVWTTDTEATAGADGAARFRGFYGDYEVAAGGRTEKVRFDTDGKEAAV